MLTYTSTFKIHSLETESSVIQLAESAWIERSNEFVGSPKGASSLNRLFQGTLEDPNYGLAKFSPYLISSPVRIRTVHSESEFETNPFGIHDCAHIAIALSIVCDGRFVCGLESFYNSSGEENKSYSPYFSCFLGEPSSPRITKLDEPMLLQTYDYVHKSLTKESWESETNWLLLLYLKTVTHHPYQHFHVLKLGLNHLFTPWHASILNTALFFERLLTKESDKTMQGVECWNKAFGNAWALEADLIEILFLYRHTVAHSNPTRAKRRIAEWFTRWKGSPDDFSESIQQRLRSAARMCVRATVIESERFKEFLDKRPK